MITAIFYNRRQSRLRAGWRILIYFVFLFGTVALTSFAVRSALPAGPIRSSVNLLVLPFVLFGSLVAAGRYLDHREFKSYGFHLSKGWWLDIMFGFGLGALIFCAIFLFEKAMGWVAIACFFQNQRDGYIGLPFAVPLAIGFLAFVAVGLMEEIVFRGYLISNLAEGLNRKNTEAKKALIGAAVLSSVIFGLFHSANPNTTAVGVINIAFMGLLLVLPYVLSGELAMPIAIHMSWNFFQGHVFGFPVSGVAHQVSFVAIDQTGPSIWTGGAFGPEGGLVGTAAAALGCVLVLLWYKMTHRPASLFLKLAEFHPPISGKNGAL